MHPDLEIAWIAAVSSVAPSPLAPKSRTLSRPSAAFSSSVPAAANAATAQKSTAISFMRVLYKICPFGHSRDFTARRTSSAKVRQIAIVTCTRNGWGVGPKIIGNPCESDFARP